MAKYGNSGGRNKGKKYKKLHGFEQATPETEARAREFMQWYGDNFDALRDKLIYDHLYDDEIATDTALYLYDCIALKGFVIKDYKFYYLRAYHTARLAALKKRTPEVSIDDEERIIQLSAPDFNYEKYEAVVDQLNTEILEYVRANYDAVAVSLFEIYIGLQPDISYKRLAVMLDIPVTKIWTSIGAIRKGVAAEFGARKGYLLSHI